MNEHVNKIRDEQRAGLTSEHFPQDANQMSPEMAEFVRNFLITMLSGKVCVHCQAPIEKKEQVGGCVYASPCGHRQYHGSAELESEEKV